MIGAGNSLVAVPGPKNFRDDHFFLKVLSKRISPDFPLIWQTFGCHSTSVLRKTIPAQTFTCANDVKGFTGAGWLGWRSPGGVFGLVLWGTLTRLQAGYLAQQVRAFSRPSASSSGWQRPQEAVIDLTRLNLEDQETQRALRQFGGMPDLSPHATHLTVIVASETESPLSSPDNSTATIAQQAFRHWGPVDSTSIETNPDHVYPRLGITNESELCEQMKQALNHPPQIDFTKQHLQTYVSAHLTKPNINEACSELNLTRRTLQRRLYEAGTSFQKVVIATRIEVAKQQLSEGKAPITQIAVDVGFATLQAFSSAFRRETGLSPSNFRSASQKQPDSYGQAPHVSSADSAQPAGASEVEAEAQEQVCHAPESGTHPIELDLIQVAALG